MAKQRQSKYEPDKTYKVVMTKHNDTQAIREVTGDKVPEIEREIVKHKDKIHYYWVEEKYESNRKH